MAEIFSVKIDKDKSCDKLYKLYETIIENKTLISIKFTTRENEDSVAITPLSKINKMYIGRNFLFTQIKFGTDKDVVKIWWDIDKMMDPLIQLNYEKTFYSISKIELIFIDNKNMSNILL